MPDGRRAVELRRAGVRRRPAGRPGRWTATLRAATGLPDLEPEVLDVARFTLAAAVATRYRSGPGFLVGDAAHRTTPVAGIGLNTAVHDGHELGWKLAWVARGLAGEALLDSHDAERGPVGLAAAERSLDVAGRPTDGLASALGHTHRSPVIAATGSPRTCASTWPPGRASGRRTPGSARGPARLHPRPLRRSVDARDGRPRPGVLGTGDRDGRPADGVRAVPLQVLADAALTGPSRLRPASRRSSPRRPGRLAFRRRLRRPVAPRFAEGRCRSPLGRDRHPRPRPSPLA